MTTPISTSAIDSAFTAAITAAQALGSSVTRIAPVAVAGEAGQTVQTDTLTYKGSKGFRVTAVIQLAGYRATRIHETLPVLKETTWPSDIAAEAKQWLSDSIIAGEAWVAAQGFWGTRTTDLSFTYLTVLQAEAGNTAALAAARPILASLYSWIMAVRAAAAAGGRMFSRAPHSYEDFITETHA